MRVRCSSNLLVESCCPSSASKGPKSSGSRSSSGARTPSRRKSGGAAPSSTAGGRRKLKLDTIVDPPVGEFLLVACLLGRYYNDPSMVGTCCIGGAQQSVTAESEHSVPAGTKFYMKTKVDDESATLMLIAARRHKKDGVGMVLRVSLEGSRKSHASEAVVEHIKVAPAY